MKLPTKSRVLLYALLLAGMLAAAASSPNRAVEEKNQVASATVAKVTAKPADGDERGSVELDLARLNRVVPAGEAANAFASKSWYVPPPPPPPPPPTKPAPPPPPTAPPLPFSYLGRYEDGAKPIIFLVKGDSVLSVSEGDVIDDAYRVDGIHGSMLDLTYLPLNIKQTINVGEAG